MGTVLFFFSGMYKRVFILNENIKNKEACGFLSGELMSGGTCTQSNKRFTIFSHISWSCDPTVTPND